MNLNVIPNDEWTDTVADVWLGRLRINPGLRICLPTGTTPVPVYAAMRGAPFGGSTIFLLDEFGGLPAGHPGSCRAMLCRTFLDRLTEPPLVSHFLDVDSNDLDSVCRNYENLIADGGLDLAILGLGRNGHLGLNEPGSPPDSKTRVVELAAETRAGVGRYGIDDPPTWGVTVGLGTLLEAREVWLFVRGADKSNVLRRVLREPVGSHLPASYLRNHPNSVIWADQAAAGADI